MNHRSKILAAVALGGLMFSGCSGSSLRLKKASVGEEKLVERVPPRRPDWLDKIFEEKKGKFYFKGDVSGVQDRSLGFRQAKANGTQMLVEAVKIKARSEFSEAVKGVNAPQASLGRYLDSVIAWTSENVEISGLIPEEQYYEKYAVKTGQGVRYRFDCYVKLSVPVENYLRAREMALNKAVQEAPDPEAKVLAEEVKEKLLQ